MNNFRQINPCPLCILHPGIWTWIILPTQPMSGEYRHWLQTKITFSLTKAATETIFPFDRRTNQRISRVIPLYWSNPHKTIFTLPTSCWPAFQKQIAEQGIPYLQKPNPSVSPEHNTEPIWFDSEEAFGGVERSLNHRGQPIRFDPAQKEACLQIAALNKSMRIGMPMGSAKSLILAWIIFALRGPQGHRNLRPLTLAGKSLTDTRQLYETLQNILAANPQWQTKENHLCLQFTSRPLKTTDKRHLENGNGILITTHRSLHKIPVGTRCILIDEEHAAATPAVLQALMRHSQRCQRIYGATATANMRADKGDRLLRKLIGPLLLQQQYRDYEPSGRIAPIHLHIYPFTARAPYEHDPTNPYRNPPGNSLYQSQIENHAGRHRFIAELFLSLPATETKVMFLPTIGHAQKIYQAVQTILQSQFRQNILSTHEAQQLLPVILHAQGSNQINQHENAQETQKRLVQQLLSGQIKSAIVTDFLSAGVDTAEIHHVIDASGQVAKGTNIQRSGRAGRPLEGKISKLHVIKDEHHPSLVDPINAKIRAYTQYYGFIAETDIPETSETQISYPTKSRIFFHSPNSNTQHSTPQAYLFITKQLPPTTALVVR
jgi:superfamily II DNA or RNA helicase